MVLAFKELLSLLTLTRRDITTIIIFAVAIGLLSLVVPIAAQGLVTIVSFGNLRQPLFILAIVVFVLLIFSAISRLLQNILVETIQQRIFASIALRIATRLPRINMAIFDNHHGSELLNKFFDVMTLQKTVANILLNISAFILQALVGMILLALYHPALLAFDILFVAILLLIIILPYSRGVETALEESDAKYDVAAWLEEMARVPLLFHFQKNAEFGFERTDQTVVKYLKTRQAHYKVILQHMIGAYGLQVLASTSLFVIGGLLVLNNQMTLGQLVAAEIVTTSLGASAAKIANYLERVYDLRAAAEKVNALLVLPTENFSQLSHALSSHVGAFKAPPQVSVKNLVFANNHIKHSISFMINAGASVVLMLDSETRRSQLIDSLLGLRPAISGEIEYNNILLANYPFHEFRKKISLIRNIEYFNGTILENVTIGNPNTHIEEIMRIIHELSLREFIASLPQGLKFPLVGSLQPFTNTQLMKLIFVREILSQSFFMVIDKALDIFSLDEAKTILSVIKKNCPQQTLLVTTNRHEIASLFENRISL